MKGQVSAVGAKGAFETSLAMKDRVHESTKLVVFRPKAASTEPNAPRGLDFDILGPGDHPEPARDREEHGSSVLHQPGSTGCRDKGR